jgi:hypothetical protein
MLKEDDVSAVNTKLKPHNSSEQKWSASLDMTFAHRANKTVLSGSKRQGRLAIINEIPMSDYSSPRNESYD